MTNIYPQQPPLPTQPKKKKGWFRRSWPIGLAAVLGLGIGAAGAGGGTTSAPAAADPEVITETKTETVEVQVTDPLCQEVAEELFSILEGTVNQALIPYSDVTQTIIGQLSYGPDIGTLEAATATLEGIANDTSALTGRINTVSGEYQDCIS